MEHRFQYSSEIQEVSRIRDNIEEVARLWLLPPSELRQVKVIIEELFSNIIRFAYSDTHKHFIEIRMQKEEQEIRIEIIDDGIPFNPLDFRPESSSDPAGFVEGGMGLTLVRTFSDSISYLRKNHQNHLQITKKIKSKT